MINSLWRDAKYLYLFLLLSGLASPLVAAELTLPGYQRGDGAIVLHYGGDRIDPYFASKALLVAKAAGLNVDVAAKAWVEWVITQQLEDGRFFRMCIDGANYLHCEKADADDALLAVWIELLLSIASEEGMPTHWHKSWQQASNYLFSLLFDRKRGIFYISRSERVGLLMDNVEVYSALNTTADYYARKGDAGRAQLMRQRATQLNKDIVQTFWQPQQHVFAVSTEEYEHHGFYPDAVAQLYPLLARMTAPGHDARSIYRDWMQEHQQAWLEQGKHDYPWGLVALLANQMEDRASVGCWIEHAQPLRHGQRWNVLEEVVFQGLNKDDNKQQNMGKGSSCLALPGSTH